MARTFTSEELAAFDGSDANKPVYIAVKGIVYDVSPSREFYGKGGPYEAFAGRECSRALAIMKVDVSECNDNLSDCTEKQLKTLDDWIAKFNSKYQVAGQVFEGVPEELRDMLPVGNPNRSLMLLLGLLLVLTGIGAYILYHDLHPQAVTKEEL